MTKLIQRMRKKIMRHRQTLPIDHAYLFASGRRFQALLADAVGQDTKPVVFAATGSTCLEERKLDVDTYVVSYIAALRIFYLKTPLKRPAMREGLPYPNRKRLGLPTILTPEEVSRADRLSARNLFHYTMLLTMYSAGLRRSELCKLKVSNIDSGRMVIRIERGKGGVDREVPLNPKLLTTLFTAATWHWMSPKNLSVPGHQQQLPSRQTDHLREGDLGSRASPPHAKPESRKPFTPHRLPRAMFFPPTCSERERNGIMQTIRVLMGHKDIEATTRYLHVSPKHLQDELPSYLCGADSCLRASTVTALTEVTLNRNPSDHRRR